MKSLFALLLLLLVSLKSFAHWTTGTNISNTKTGQVSIGTTGVNDNSSAKLTVYNDANPTTLVVGNPSTGTGEVFTDCSAFPDYVFAPEYTLRSLEETEKYVKENHHLPKVPSAGEIAKDCMSLSGMNEILLKKIEEITLYLIEMKKENETLKKRLELLEKNK